MQVCPLAHTVSLHRVWVQDSYCDNVGARDEGSVPAAVLEPIVVFNNGRSGNNDRGSRECVADACASEDVVEKNSVLCSLLKRFCGRLLLKTMNGGGLQPAGGAYGAKDVSPIGEEGLFIQVPSCQFGSACLRAAGSGTAMDVVCYNSGSCGEDEKRTDDEGYLYGFTYFIYTGCAAEGLLITILSASPLFNTMRTIVLETVPHVLCISHGIGRGHFGSQNVEGLARADNSAYTKAMWPLSDLVDGCSNACKTPVNNHFYLQFERASVPVIRPNDLHHPFTDVPLRTLCLSFSYDALRVIHSLLLQEERVVFIGVTPQHASACVISAQSMLVPFIWALPIVPYLPPEGFGVVEEMWASSSFMLGSTAEILPRLMLYGSDTAGVDRAHIWIADARTGFVGVSPDHSRRFFFAPTDLVPSSDKVEDAVKSLVSKEQRQAFRQVLGAVVAQAHVCSVAGSGALSTDRSLNSLFHVEAAPMEEAHDAFVEYSASRLLGNYRKGLSPMRNTGGSYFEGHDSSTTWRQPNRIVYSLDYQRFLPDNLGGNSKFATAISKTRLYHNWEVATLLVETLGLLSFLDGTIVRQSCSNRLYEQNSHSLRGGERDPLSKNYYISHPRMIGMLSSFYIRASRRFPDLYQDLPAADVARLSAAMLAKAGRDQGGTGASKSKSGKGLMRSLFSKATKAVKSSLTTSRQRIPVHVFVQARSSLSSDAKHSDPDKILKASKGIKDVPPTTQKTPPEQDLGSTSIPRPITPLGTGESEEDIARSFSGAACGAETSGMLQNEATGADGSGIPMPCRLLPLDVIHNFGQYHRLLDPTKDTAYTTGYRVDTSQEVCTHQLEIFLELGQLFAADVNIWLFLEAKRSKLLTKGHPPKQQPPEERAEPPPDLWIMDSGVGPCAVPFEAQPLPFSMDLITGSPELPPPFQ